MLLKGHWRGGGGSTGVVVGVEGIRLTGLYGDWGISGGGLFLGSVRQHRVSRSRRREEDGVRKGDEVG